MRSIFTGIALLLLFQANSFSQSKPTLVKNASAKSATGYNINITLVPYKNTWVYLGSHYGKYKNLSDSAWLNEKSMGVFKGNAKLPQGIYFIVSPAKTLLFEVLMDKGQAFSIQADTTNLNVVNITGSLDNQIFHQYTSFLAQKTPELNQLQEQLKQSKTSADSTNIKTRLNSAAKQLQDYRENLLAKYPSSMLSTFFQTMKRPEVPAVPIVNGKADSSYPYYYVKAHWWDDVSLDNDALVRTPFFEQKLEDYFKYYVPPTADSIIPEVNYMLLSARNSNEMFKYLLGKFTDKYINPEYMGQEKVFLFLFDKYFSKGDTAWLSQKQRQYIFDRAYSLMANQLGEAAPELQMLDTSGRSVSLYNTKAPFTFISFWDPNCGHCKETIPRVDSIYNAKWKKLGVQLIGVNVDEGAMDGWKKFINEHHLNGWLHIYQPKSVKEAEAKRGQANYRQLYDVFKTPTLYLLDADKHIIGKMLSIEQFDDVLEARIKTDKITK